MPLPQSEVDAVVGPYRDILASIRAQGTTAPEVGELASAVAEMERRASLHDEVGAFVADITNDGLFTTFNDAHARLVSAQADAARPDVTELPDPSIPSDDDLENRLITRLRSALQRLEVRPDFPYVRRPVEEVVTAIERGASYPVILRVLAERGLDLVTQGIVHSRQGLVADLEAAQQQPTGPRVALLWALLSAYDELAARGPFGLADPLEYHLRRCRIEWDHTQTMANHDAFGTRVHRAVVLVVDWLDAWCSFAPRDPRFRSESGEEATQRTIRFARDCYPGFLAVREQLLTQTWGVSFESSLTQLARDAATVPAQWSPARLDLARQTRPFCVPGGVPPDKLIQAAEELHAQQDTGLGAAPVAPTATPPTPGQRA